MLGKYLVRLAGIVFLHQELLQVVVVDLHLLVLGQVLHRLGRIVHSRLR